MSLQKIGPLNSLNTNNGADVGVVFFHGYGANAYDLAPLANEMQIKKNVDFYFPDAPLELNMGGYSAGRAWFPIDEKDLEEAMARGGFREYEKIRPPGVDKAVKQAVEFLNLISEKHKSLIIGGFSQGAMLATDIVMQQKFKPKALMLLSGTLFNKDRWVENMKSIEHLDIFQSHGESDMVLSFDAAKNLNQLFEDRGYQTEFHGFRGGHEIPRQVLKQLEHFINYRA